MMRFYWVKFQGARAFDLPEAGHGFSRDIKAGKESGFSR
jgi:hypothetical protein